MANEQKPGPNAKTEAASPSAIGEATLKVAATLAAFTPQEQGRIIHAAAAINGLQSGKK